MLHWIQYIKGYVSIKVWGYSTERFLNLCSNHDILVWDIENHEDYYTMKVSLQGFFALKTLLKKTGTRATVLQRYGLPFFVPKIKKRKIFVLGLLACLFFWIFTSRYLWDIEIEGNYSLTEDVILDYLEEQGIHTAMPKKDLAIEELEMQLREAYDVITWVSLKIEGTTLIIQMRENETKNYDQSSQSKETKETAKDITAAKAGVIVYMITRQGVPQVAVGESVEAGQILVSGAVPVYNEDETIRKYQYYEADADILISYDKTISVKEDIVYKEKQYSGKEKKMWLLGVKEKEVYLPKEIAFPFGKISYNTYDVLEEKRQVRLLNHLYLPLYYGEKTLKEYTWVQKEHTKEEMQQIMEEEWKKILKTLEEKGVQITRKNVTIKKNKEKWIMNAKMQLEEAAVKKTINTTPQIPVTESEEKAEE